METYDEALHGISFEFDCFWAGAYIGDTGTSLAYEGRLTAAQQPSLALPPPATGGRATVPVSGRFEWTCVRVADAKEAAGLRSVATEVVQGTWEADTKELYLTGINSQSSLRAYEYKMTLSEDGQVFKGCARVAANIACTQRNPWRGVIFCTAVPPDIRKLASPAAPWCLSDSSSDAAPPLTTTSTSSTSSTSVGAAATPAPAAVGA
jgi:hypothetical protein